MMQTETDNKEYPDNISVVICTRNRIDDLRDCFESIKTQLYLPDEIIVVDSSDSRETELLVKEFQSDMSCPFVYIHTAPSLTRQRNIGIRESKGAIIAFLDDDVILEEDYFLETVKCFSQSNKIAGVGGTLTNATKDGFFSFWFKKIFMLTSYDGKKAIMKRSGFADFAIVGNKTRVEEAEILVGCSCAYRREIFERYSFDEFFDGYGAMEDIEFSYRVSRQNTLLYTPKAKLVHKKSAVDRDNLARKYEMLIYNHYYVFKKNVLARKTDWLFFGWSDLGMIFYALIWMIFARSMLPLKGIYEGHKKILG